MRDVVEYVVNNIKDKKPSLFSKRPQFSFISLHWIWILGVTIIASILIYAGGTGGNGRVAYIDALYFASGCTTQAGLNPVDVNLLNTFQQIVMYLTAQMTCPITINIYVVFVRLFWFEKRFQNVVRDARQNRVSIAMSRSKSKAKGAYDISQLERGVGGRNINVMHEGPKSRITNDGTVLSPLLEGKAVASGSGNAGASGSGALGLHAPNGGSSSSKTHDDDNKDPKDATVTPDPNNHQSAIKFSETVTRSDGMGSDAMKTPQNGSQGGSTPQPHFQMQVSTAEESDIAILQRQRDHDETLRIPGPRDADSGAVPKLVEHGGEDGHPLEPAATTGGRSVKIAEPKKEDGHDEKKKNDEKDKKPHNENNNNGQMGTAPEHTGIVEDVAALKNILYMFRIRVPRVFRSKSQQKIHQDHNDDELRHRQQSFKSRRAKTMDNIRGAFAQEKTEGGGMPYLSWQPTLGRNSAFSGMTEGQRDELGGLEYRALKTLAIVLLWYFWGVAAIGVLGLVPWIYRTERWGQVVDASGMNRAWWGFFTANSAYMDLGFTLTPDSMNSFSTAVFPLLMMSFLIYAGNVAFPILLRFVIWVMSLFVPVGSGVWEELRFLLDHPRRCFTLLFPARATWWLLCALVLLNGIDLLLFMTLDINNASLEGTPTGIRVLDAIFQAAATRTAGFTCLNLSLLHPAVQVSYMIMMYISVFPVAISVRRTNVYEEQSLGVFGGPAEPASDGQTESDMSHVGAHLRRQLSFDLWYLFIGLFVIAISEGDKIQRGDISLFAILFEVVSAYGTVGLSLGFTGVNAAMSSQFTVVGKLVMVAMQLRGRHRGLPYTLDRAILLPSEALNKAEQADADARQARRISMATASANFNNGVGGLANYNNRKGGRSFVSSRSRTSLAGFLSPGPTSASQFEPAEAVGGRSVVAEGFVTPAASTMHSPLSVTTALLSPQTAADGELRNRNSPAAPPRATVET